MPRPKAPNCRSNGNGRRPQPRELQGAQHAASSGRRSGVPDPYRLYFASSNLEQNLSTRIPQTVAKSGLAMRRLLHTIPFVLLVLLAGVFVVRILDPDAADRALRPMLGKQIPNFSLPVLGDPTRTVGPEDYSGDWLLVNLWGSWCAPCREEHGELMRIGREEDIPILGINTWDTYEAAQAFLRELGDPYTLVGFDVEGDARMDLAVTGVPETLLVGPRGLVVVHHIGPLTRDVFEADFRGYLQ